nr:MAG TPA: sugar O-acyltransferase, sialic acid O-acetyltransferase NeuD family [Caudoviricetes sp.]
MKLYGIVGAGGYGREVMPLVQEVMLKSHLSADTQCVFVVENAKEKVVNGFPVLSPEEFFAIPADEKYFNVAIAASRARERISTLFIDKGILPFSVTSNHSVIYSTSEIGEGAIINPFAIISANSKVGRFFHANVYSYIAHDCIIGNYVTFAPGVKCCGNVVVEDHAYVGAGAVIRQNTAEQPIIIGAGAVIGMGAIVTKSVPAGITVAGNPARPLIK